MIKYAQIYTPELVGKTLSDLLAAIRIDPGMSPIERQILINQIENAAGGLAPSTPLSVLMARGLGGALGYLVSKYFRMGPIGQAVSIMAGVGLGKSINNLLTPAPTNMYPGFRVLN